MKLDEFEKLLAEIDQLEQARDRLASIAGPDFTMAIEAIENALARLHALKIEAYYARKGVDSDPQA